MAVDTQTISDTGDPHRETLKSVKGLAGDCNVSIPRRLQGDPPPAPACICSSIRIADKWQPTGHVERNLRTWEQIDARVDDLVDGRIVRPHDRSSSRISWGACGECCAIEVARLEAKNGGVRRSEAYPPHSFARIGSSRDRPDAGQRVSNPWSPNFSVLAFSDTTRTVASWNPSVFSASISKLNLTFAPADTRWRTTSS